MEFDAIVLAGGRSSRMGAEKSGLLFEGRSLVEVAVSAARAARRVVVVGPGATADAIASATGDARIARVLTAREEPAWGGPAAALVAGLDRLAADPARNDTAEWLLVLACDLPRGDEAAAALVAAAVAHTSTACEAVVAVDGSGRRQPLLALYRTDAVARAAASARKRNDLVGLPLRRLVGTLDTVEVCINDALCADVDTPDQARAFGIQVAAVI